MEITPSTLLIAAIAVLIAVAATLAFAEWRWRRFLTREQHRAEDEGSRDAYLAEHGVAFRFSVMPEGTPDADWDRHAVMVVRVVAHSEYGSLWAAKFRGYCFDEHGDHATEDDLRAIAREQRDQFCLPDGFLFTREQALRVAWEKATPVANAWVKQWLARSPRGVSA
ncbi:hypothetical protein JOF53_006559 [Crossiella equi]|uniref:DUF2726 domain-containing protein n=1 Tax=Crossiella equi TaxID=130796 RepID=A0ABS5AMR6_9PSEU|nr:hypothetical protein [Crossiella equi]MBP2477687.1 hypothetical protein [Crossiella equi]